jgi:small-conductance mechanosensitive channel
VIEVGHTYGSVTSLGARYASVHGRDGKAYLIPNETLITNQVVNWSYSSSLLRLDLMFAVPTDADLHEVREFAVNAARQVKRVVGTPAPVCHLTEFGDNAIQLTLRFWIEDPANGVKNVKGDVYLALWDAMRAHGVSLPNPQREIRIRELPEAWSQPAHRREAAE